MAAAAPMNEDFDNCSFVQIVEKFPLIYNQYLPEHSNKNAVEQAWQKISQLSKIPVDVCKIKWKNIRTCFQRQFRIRCPSGSAAKGKGRPYYLSDVLSFLKPYARPRVQSSNLRVVEDRNEETRNEETTEVEVLMPMDARTEDFDADDDFGDETSFDFSMNEGVSLNSSSISGFDVPLSKVATASTKPSTSKPVNDFTDTELYPSLKKKRKSADNLDDVAKMYFTKKASQYGNKDPDNFMSFMETLLPHLNAFSPAQKRQCKLSFLKTVCDIEEENEKDKC